MNDLYHHGVKGMKWGVIKQRVKNRYDKGRALTVLDSHSRSYGSNAKTYDKMSKKAQSKSERYKEKGLTDLSAEYAKRSKTYAALGKAYVKAKLDTDVYMKDIKNNTLKAGRDYVVKSKQTFSTNTYTIYDADGNERYSATYSSTPLYIGG